MSKKIIVRRKLRRKLKATFSRPSKESFNKLKTDIQRLKPFFVLLRCLGMFVTKLRNDTFEIGSRWNCCLPIVWIIIHVYYVQSRISTIVVYHNKTTRNRVIGIFTILSEVLNLVTYLYEACSCIFMQRQFSKFIEKLEMYDDWQKTHGLRMKHKNFILLICWLFLMIFFAVRIADVYSKTGFTIFTLSFLTHLEWLLLGFTLPCISVKFAFFTNMLRERFIHLSYRVVPWLQSTISAPHQGQETIEIITRLHIILLDAADHLLSIYKVGLLIFYVQTTVTMIDCMKKSIFRQSYVELDEVFILIFQLIITCGICHYTAKAANELGLQVLFNTPLFITDDGIDRLYFATYMLHNQLSFTALDLFTINLPLITTIGTTALFFGIFMLQVR